MSRKILGLFFAAALSLPAIASADKNVWTPHQMPDNNNTSQTTRLQQQQMNDRLMNKGSNSVGSLGNGDNGKSNGNVTGPGTAPVDTSVKGPLNDVQPGNPQSEDTPRSARPR